MVSVSSSILSFTEVFINVDIRGNVVCYELDDIVDGIFARPIQLLIVPNVPLIFCVAEVKM